MPPSSIKFSDDTPNTPLSMVLDDDGKPTAEFPELNAQIFRKQADISDLQFTILTQQTELRELNEKFQEIERKIDKIPEDSDELQTLQLNLRKSDEKVRGYKRGLKNLQKELQQLEDMDKIQQLKKFIRDHLVEPVNTSGDLEKKVENLKAYLDASPGIFDLNAADVITLKKSLDSIKRTPNRHSEKLHPYRAQICRLIGLKIRKDEMSRGGFSGISRTYVRVQTSINTLTRFILEQVNHV